MAAHERSMKALEIVVADVGSRIGLPLERAYISGDEFAEYYVTAPNGTKLWRVTFFRNRSGEWVVGGVEPQAILDCIR